MAMGIPIVCNTDVGDTDYVVEKYNSGILVKKFNNDEYKVAIDKMLENEFEPKHIMKGAEDFYSLKMGVKQYHEVYQKMVL